MDPVAGKKTRSIPVHLSGVPHPAPHRTSPLPRSPDPRTVRPGPTPADRRLYRAARWNLSGWNRILRAALRRIRRPADNRLRQTLKGQSIPLMFLDKTIAPEQFSIQTAQDDLVYQINSRAELNIYRTAHFGKNIIHHFALFGVRVRLLDA